MANMHARTLRTQMTDAERRLWKHLRELNRRGSHFRRQVPIGAYIVDFCWHSARLVIEVDGGQHNEDVARERDAQRTRWLESRGYRVIRFWNNEVLGNEDGVLQVILDALKQTPTPTPPRKGEGLNVASSSTPSPQGGGASSS